MYHYEYVSKREAEPYRNEFLEIIHEVQDLLRDKFTFRYDFIGSSSRNMITYDPTTNKGFDFDINLQVNDDDEEYDAKDLKTLIMTAIDKVARPKGFAPCENKTRVIRLKKLAHYPYDRIEYSCDFAIVYNYEDDDGHRHQQYVHYQKNQDLYRWNEQSKGYNLDEKADWIKHQEGNLWDEVLEVYLDKKNSNNNLNKKSRALYAETINEVSKRHGYSAKNESK